MSEIRIIQGGMGVGVSAWPLAQAVARAGQLGVVSGTGLAIVLARRLQEGDPGGHVRRAMGRFPVAGVADRVLNDYFIAGGKPADAPFRRTPMPTLAGSRALAELTVLGNFVEVFLAKEGHEGRVGINYLEKLQLPTLPSLFGAMLGGVDYVLMGAGVPRFIPGILDALARGEATEMRIDVQGAASDERTVVRFDPVEFCGGAVPTLRRPRFLAIVSSALLATTLARKSNGTVDGFVVEGATAGGHNAPPRGPMRLDDRGQPIYGPRDVIDLADIRKLGLPFWMAGGFGDPARLAEALAAGAAGIQVGTAFAFCDESGIDPQIKRQVIRDSLAGQARVFTDPAASPTGFPFKVLQVPGSLADRAVYDGRQRVCDLGYLRHAYRRDDGSIGFRCAAEPVEHYVAKGGSPADTAGRMCVCNALFATIGLPQVDDRGATEPALVTAGDDVANLRRFVPPGGESYRAADVIRYLLRETGQPVTADAGRAGHVAERAHESLDPR